VIGVLADYHHLEMLQGAKSDGFKHEGCRRIHLGNPASGSHEVPQLFEVRLFFFWAQQVTPG
jgi:hypothetical protein